MPQIVTYTKDWNVFSHFLIRYKGNFMKHLIVFSLFLSLSSLTIASEWCKYERKAHNLPWYDLDEQNNQKSPVACQHASQPKPRPGYADYDDGAPQQTLTPAPHVPEQACVRAVLLLARATTPQAPQASSNQTVN